MRAQRFIAAKPFQEQVGNVEPHGPHHFIDTAAREAMNKHPLIVT